MPDRENMLHKVRTALGHHGSQRPEPPAPPRLVVPPWDSEERVRRLVESFPGEAVRAASLADARHFITSRIEGRTAVVSNDPLLAELDLAALPAVRSGMTEEQAIREACADSDVGVTGADYALADPPALVMLSSSRNDRLMSLLPPSHIAVIRASSVLSGLDELFSVLPDPAAVSSSMVLIGGPSRTGDIEMTLTLGVHGPREIALVVV